MRKIIIAAVAGLTMSLTACSSGPSAEELCQEMKENSQRQGSNPDKITEGEYLKLREKFANVDDDQLSKSGVQLVDAVWQLQNFDEGEEMAALAFTGELTEAISNVSSACAQHGVTLNMLG